MSNPVIWTQQDAVSLRTYIASNPKFLLILQRDHRPKIEGNTMEARAVTGSDVKGFFDAIDAITAMQQDPDKQTDEAGFLDNKNNDESDQES